MIVEIKGVKLDVDERYATNLDQLKVGDKLKVLVKNYNDSYDIFPGVVVGFSNFAELPTIEVCYFKNTYSSPELVITGYNEKSELRVIKAIDDLPVEQADVIALFDRDIARKEIEVKELAAKKAWFLRWFGKTQHEQNNEE